MATLRIGVLGCARIARQHTIPALVADPSVDLVAIASRNREKAEDFARQFDCEAVTGYAELLDRTDIDAVYVPLPPALHALWVGQALDSGKHVLAEKPLSTDLAEATAMVDRARAGNLLLMENFAFLHHSQHAEVRRLLDTGAVGELRSLSAEFGFPPLHPDDIRYQPSLGGGALLDAGVYTLRLATLYLGRQLGVEGAVLRQDPSTGVDIGGGALVATPDRRVGQLSFGFDRSYRCSYTLWGSEGTITLERAFSTPATLRPVVRLQRQDHVQELTLPADTQFANLVRAFAGTVLNGGDATTPGEDILLQARLQDQVRSAALGSPR
jgi:NDP-hexose-3-ketoreductase